MKKDLLLIMRRSTVPIEFTSSYIILMNLDSFVGVSMKCLLLHDIEVNPIFHLCFHFIWLALRPLKRNEFLKRSILRIFSKPNRSFIFTEIIHLFMECVIMKIANVHFLNICSYSKQTSTQLYSI